MRSPCKLISKLRGFAQSRPANSEAALASGAGPGRTMRLVPAGIAALLIWITAISGAHAQSCTLYEANVGLGAESNWEETSQQATRDLIELCNSGVPGNRGCFAGYDSPPQYYGCDEDTTGVICTAEMPAAIPTPAYGHPDVIMMSVLVTTPTGSSMQEVPMQVGANVWNPCPYYFVQATLVSPPVADQGCHCHAPTNGRDPVDPAIGNEFLEESDVEPLGWRGRLGFKRYYNSLDTSASDMGPGWRHSFGRYLKVQTITLNSATVSASYSTQADACTSGWAQIRSSVSGFQTASASFAAGVCTVSNGSAVAVVPISATPWGASGNHFPEVLAYRDDGHVMSFLSNGQAYTAEPGTGLQLLQTAGNYQIIDEDDNVETYNSAGKLISIADPSGNLETLGYNASTGFLTSITDSFGHALTFAYDSQSRLQTVTAPDSSFVQYGYNSAGELEQVRNLDGSTRQYVYTDPNWPTGLSSVVDENGQTEFTLSYDSQGRVISSTLGGVSSSMSFTYNSNGTTTETDPLGAVRTFASLQIGDHELSSSVSGAPCYRCGYVAATTYDVNGFPTAETDFNGNVTASTYDDSRGLETSRTEASGNSAARTVTTQWHPV